MSSSIPYKEKVIRPTFLVSTRCLRQKYIAVYIYYLFSFGTALNVTCGNSWKKYEQSGTCVKAFNKRKTWDEARQNCRNEGGDLIKILDSTMNKELSNHITWSRPSVYIGLRRQGSNTTSFRWLDEKQDANYMSAGYTYQNNQTCVITILPPNGNVKRHHWKVLQCRKKHSYVCEKKPEIFCPNIWYPNSRSGTCIQLIRNKTTWNDARKVCQELGGDLAVILDKSSELFLWDQTVKRPGQERVPIWIGINDLQSKDNFQWLNYFVDGVNYTNWEKNPKDYNHKTSKCGVLTGRITSFWVPANCSEKKAFICEKYADCKWKKNGMVCPKNCTSTACLARTLDCNLRNGICQIECKGRRYGVNCSKNCSSFCAGPGKECNYITGWCKFGCQKGYGGRTCDIACSNNRYGANCSKTCSPHCSGRNNICSPVNGSCTSGCVQGFYGQRCEKKIPKKKVIYSVLAMIAAASFSSLVVLICALTCLARECLSQRVSLDQNREEDMAIPELINEKLASGPSYSSLPGILQGANDDGTSSIEDSEALGQQKIEKKLSILKEIDERNELDNGLEENYASASSQEG